MSKVNDRVFEGVKTMLAVIPQNVQSIAFCPTAFRSKFRVGTISTRALFDLIDDMLTWEDTYPVWDNDLDLGPWTLGEIHFDMFQLSRASKQQLDFDTFAIKPVTNDPGEDEDEEGSDEG